MSLRVMKKLMEQQQISSNPTAKEDTEEETDLDDEEGEEVAVKPAKNNFGLLWSELVEEDEAYEDNDEDDEIGAGGKESQQDSSVTTTSSSKKSKKKKKKNKKLKGKESSVEEAVNSGDSATLQESINELKVDDAEDTASESKKGNSHEDKHPHHALCTEGLSRLIKADPNLMRAEDELKRIFGAKVMREVDRQDASSSGSAQQRAAIPAARGGARQLGNRRQGRVSAGRKFILVQPLDTWPPVDKGDLTMEQVKSTSSHANEPLWFKHIQSNDYIRVSDMLQDCIESHDPNVMVNLMARYPSHAEGLLALFDLYRHVGEAQVASELLERALYVLESAWHPYFTPTQGNCRLDYAWEPNQTLFLALFRNTQQLSKRGCHRAAFECAKLLFSLNPDDDPHGMLLCLDYYALRAEQGPWLEEFVANHGNKSLSLLPNFAFSLALAQFGREKDSVEGSTEAVDHTQSAELLRDAILLHPYVLPLLVKKAPIQASWSKGHEHFLWRDESFAVTLDNVSKT